MLLALIKRLWPGKKQATSPPKTPRYVPAVGSEVIMGGFRYRIRKITDKDIILRPVGNA